MLTSLVALAAAIALIVAVVMLRAVLALPFAPVVSKAVPAAPPRGLEGLYAEADRELRALGFHGPGWMLVRRIDGGTTVAPLRAVYRDAAGTIAWLIPPLDARRPHRLVVTYFSLLADGRIAISQPFDPYFEVTRTASLVARTASEPTFAAQVAAHRAWLAGLGATAPAPALQELPAWFDALSSRHVAELSAAGKVARASDGLWLPRLGFALSMLRAFLASPKPPADARPVSAERLALLARVSEESRLRAPARGAQLVLFAASVALFMGLGAWFWGAAAALALLVVVLVHELGHFLAMRAFGYRNVHLLALPLVGGVAMGVDANPSATRRAWMSLMGPLPGIVIGWLLLLAFVLGAGQGALQGWLLPLALAFLFVNYLNVLPVPPLDGAHVVASLLPPRHARLQTVLMGVAATVGALLAYLAGLPLIALLATLQLFALPAAWRLHGAERELADDPGTPRGSRPALYLRTLQVLERRLGPARDAQQRVAQAAAVVAHLECRPMGMPARAATALVYAALLIVPVGAAAAFFNLGLPGDGTAAPALARFERERAALAAAARTMSLGELVDGGDADAKRPPRASAAAIVEAEKRLGRRLPRDLRAFYETANGAPALGIAPVESLARAPALDPALVAAMPKLTVALGDGEAWGVIDAAAVRRWWLLGADAEDLALYYLPEEIPELPGHRIVSLFDESQAYADLRAYLEAQWVGVREAQIWAKEEARRNAAARTALAGAPVDALLDYWKPAGLMERWALRGRLAAPDGASRETLAAHEARLRTTLPADYREMLERNDGFPRLGLLPIADVARWRERRAAIDGTSGLGAGLEPVLHGASPWGGEPLAALDPKALDDCYVVGAYGTASPAPRPRLVWCEGGWLDLALQRRHASFRDWLVTQAAPLHAARQPDS